MAVAGAVTIVAALSLLTVSALSVLDGDDDDRQTVGIGPEVPGTDDDERSTTTVRRRATTTTSEPEVLGEVTSRDPDPTAPPTTAAPGPPPGPTPAGPVASPAPATTTPRATAPPTTVSCRNSTDPACGTFRWDPEPADAPVPVEVVSAPPAEARVGDTITLALDYVERAGAEAVGACGGWTVRGPGFSDATTCEAVAHSCARYGPHDPPVARDDRVRVTRTLTFDEPGTYRIQAEGTTATHLSDGCASPYLASWSVDTYTVTVVGRG